MRNHVDAWILIADSHCGVTMVLKTPVCTNTGDTLI